MLVYPRSGGEGLAFKDPTNRGPSRDPYPLSCSPPPEMVVRRTVSIGQIPRSWYKIKTYVVYTLHINIRTIHVFTWKKKKKPSAILCINICLCLSIPVLNATYKCVRVFFFSRTIFIVLQSETAIITLKTASTFVRVFLPVGRNNCRCITKFHSLTGESG